jgi:hypothetical protein
VHDTLYSDRLYTYSRRPAHQATTPGITIPYRTGNAAQPGKSKTDAPSHDLFTGRKKERKKRKKKRDRNKTRVAGRAKTKTGHR